MARLHHYFQLPTTWIQGFYEVPIARELFGNDEEADNGEEELIPDTNPTHEKEIANSK